MARGRRASNAGKPRTDTRPDDVSARVGTDNWCTLGAGVAAILACGVVYLGTAARDIVVGDTPELSAAAVTLGIPHPSGYPLLMLVGHAFSALPVGPLPFRVNLTAVACSTGTVGLVFWISWRLTHSRLAALVAALTLGFSTLFWSWSLVFEAFPLNNLLAATVILLLVFWQQQPDRFRYLVGAAFVMGLGMANHQTISLLGPAILYLLWRQRQVLLQRPGVVAVCSVALCAGLLPYLYVPLAASRAPRLNWGDISSLEGVVRLFLRSDYGTGTLVQSPLYSGGGAVSRIAALGGSFGALQGALILAGLVAAVREQRWYLWFALSAFLVAGVGFVSIANMELANDIAEWVLGRFFLLSHVVLAPLAAAGVLLLARLARRGLPWLTPSAAEGAVAAAALVVIGVGVVSNYHRIDESDNHIARHFGEDILATVPPGGVLLLRGDHEVGPILYLQAVEGLRTDIIIVPLGIWRSVPWYPGQFKTQNTGITLPFDWATRDSQQGTLRALVQANPGATFLLMDFLPDNSLEETGHWFFRRGLVRQVEKADTHVYLDEADAENRRLLAAYRIPDHKKVKRWTFEGLILGTYALPAEMMGSQCEQLGQRAGALEWYRRALAIDPQSELASRALARLGSS